MENKEKIVKWITENQKKFNIEITRFTGLSTFFENVYDYNISINFENNLIKGRGTSLDEDIALLKAFSECIERLALYHYNFSTSSGISAHPEYKNACINSKNELIEHDSFLCSFLLGNKLQIINNNFISELSNVTIVTYLISDTMLGSSILVAIYSNNSEDNFGLITGTSFKTERDEAILHATLEAFRGYAHYINNQNIKSISIDEFMSLDYYSFENHKMLSRNHNYLNKFLENQVNLFELKFNYENIEFNYQILDLDFIDKNLPLSVVRATSSEIQNMYLGPNIATNINYERLKKITCSAKVNVTSLPHPFD